jgi:hypothetical protein
MILSAHCVLSYCLNQSPLHVGTRFVALVYINQWITVSTANIHILD